MSDEELRDLDRRRRETGAIDDEARWIVAVLRGGRATRERVELAARLGHRPSLVALDLPPHPPVGPLGPWVARVAVTDPEAALRIAFRATAEVVGEGRGKPVLRLVAAWLEERSADRLLALVAWHDAVGGGEGRFVAPRTSVPAATSGDADSAAVVLAGGVVRHALRAATSPDPALGHLVVREAQPTASFGSAVTSVLASMSGSRFGRSSPRRRAQAWIRALLVRDVVPWLLGGRDWRPLA